MFSELRAINLANKILKHEIFHNTFKSQYVYPYIKRDGFTLNKRVSIKVDIIFSIKFYIVIATSL
jgi:hypothetical protein